MDFLTIASQMMTLSLAISLGFIARKIGVMGDSFDSTLSRLVIDVTLPCMVTSSVFAGNNTLPDIPTLVSVLGYSIGACVIVIGLAAMLPIALKLPSAERGVYSFMAAFGNIMFIGFPMLSSIFGPQAILYAVIANIPFNVATFTIGTAFISGNPLAKKTDRDENAPKIPLKIKIQEIARNLLTNWRTFLSPVQIACTLTILLALLEVDDGGVISGALSTIGGMTTPAALLIVGSSLAKYPMRHVVTNWRAYVTVAFRLLVVPIVVLLALMNFVPDPLLLGVLVVISALPVATNGMLLCLKFGGNLEVITQGTFISTLACIFTIPIIASLVV